MTSTANQIDGIQISGLEFNVEEQELTYGAMIDGERRDFILEGGPATLREIGRTAEIFFDDVTIERNRLTVVSEGEERTYSGRAAIVGFLSSF